MFPPVMKAWVGQFAYQGGGAEKMGRLQRSRQLDCGSTPAPVKRYPYDLFQSFFSISATFVSYTACHSGATRQSLSSWAPPTLASCSAVGV